MKMEELVQRRLCSVFSDDSIIYDKSRPTGGLTNYNYIMKINGKEYVIRQPGGMTELMIDRKNEKVNNTIASELGINSKCIYFDEVSGIKISEYIVNSRNIAQSNPCDFKSLRSVSDLMKRTHTSDKVFSNSFDWLVELDKYEAIIKDMRGSFFFDYTILKNQLIDFMNLNIKKNILAPCHNDTVPENFIIDETGNAFLIDWEYAGMNDPSWDVASYILESRLSEEAIEYLFNDYYENPPSEDEILKIKCYMVAQDLLWMVWAMIRHYSGDDFLDYCSYRYERFQKNIKEIIASPKYPIGEMVNI